MKTENYPIQLDDNHKNRPNHDRSLRPGTSRKWKEDAKSKAGKEKNAVAEILPNFGTVLLKL